MNLTPLIICKRICMGIQFGFEYSPLSIIQTIPLQLYDKILVLLIRQTCLNGFKKLMIAIIWAWMKSGTRAIFHHIFFWSIITNIRCCFLRYGKFQIWCCNLWLAALISVSEITFSVSFSRCTCLFCMKMDDVIDYFSVWIFISNEHTREA